MLKSTIIFGILLYIVVLIFNFIMGLPIFELKQLLGVFIIACPIYYLVTTMLNRYKRNKR